MRGESGNEFTACLDSHITHSAAARLLSCFRDWWENKIKIRPPGGGVCSMFGPGLPLTISLDICTGSPLVFSLEDKIQM